MYNNVIYKDLHVRKYYKSLHMSKNMYNYRYTLAHKKEADTCY